jgi:hypothetical protein
MKTLVLHAALHDDDWNKRVRDDSVDLSATMKEPSRTESDRFESYGRGRYDVGSVRPPRMRCAK